MRRALAVGEETGLVTTRMLMRGIQDIRRTLNGTIPGLGENLAVRLRELAEFERTFVGSRLEEAMPVGVRRLFPVHLPNVNVVVGLVTNSPFQGSLLGTYFGDGPKSFPAAVQRVLTKEIRSAVSTGMGVEDTARRLERRLKKMGRVALRNLVRTASGHAHASAREAVMQANTGKRGVIKAYQWLSTLDLSTTLQWCVPRDSGTYDPKTKRGINAKGKRYPWLDGPSRIHWGCRSTWTAVTKSWKELGIKAKEIQRRDRASMNGLVPRKTTAEQFFKRQLKDPEGRAFLEKLYGKTRIDALASGKVTIADMVKPRAGRLVTLKKLGLLEKAPVKGISDKLKNWERLHARDKLESGLLFDAKGRAIRVAGGRASIDISESVRKRAVGGRMTHNHPSRSGITQGPSLDDARFAIQHNMAEMRATSIAFGKTYSIRPGSGGWPSLSQFNSTWSRISREVEAQMREFVRRGTLTRTAATRIHGIEIWRRLEKELGIVFEITRL